jgi:predicted metal-binding membrane protein
MTHTATRLPPRERAAVATLLVILSLLAWASTARLAGDMSGMGPASGMALAHTPAWQARDVALTFLMWAVMMVAMMIPSATPMISAYAGLHRLRSATAGSIRAVAPFVAGYLIVWTAFSAGATLLQWAFHSAGLLSHASARATPLLGGSLLVLAGLYQFTRWKQVCLSRCRTPLDFLMTEWRDGTRGALVMGSRHGLFCVGCCWALMLLLFVAGMMNLVWVAILAGYVLLEKVMPAARSASWVIGLLAVAWGAWLLTRVFAS